MMRPLTIDVAPTGCLHAPRPRGRFRLLFIVVSTLTCGLAGCADRNLAMRRQFAELEAAARPLLEMDPDANWTVCYNRLLDFGLTSVDYLLRQPVMQRPAAPDDVRVMLHTSLLRLLASPATVPRLSVNCFETSLDILHLDLKVRGRRLGDVCLPPTRFPTAWHDLYPTDFNHNLAAEIDLERDRQTMIRWWQAHRTDAVTLLARRPLRPRAKHLWALLSRRYADVWTYELRPSVYLCGLPPTGAALLWSRTQDYNLVRAACIWLGTSDSPSVQRQLIELVVHPSQVVAHNARFALAHNLDPRIRDLLNRHREAARPSIPDSGAPWSQTDVALSACRLAASRPGACH